MGGGFVLKIDEVFVDENFIEDDKILRVILGIVLIDEKIFDILEDFDWFEVVIVLGLDDIVFLVMNGWLWVVGVNCLEEVVIKLGEVVDWMEEDIIK